MEKPEPITQFVKRTDFMAKLRAALEDVEQGQAFGIFEGLQRRGNCALTLSFDGVSVRLAPFDVRPEVRARIEAQQKPEPQPEKSLERRKPR